MIVSTSLRTVSSMMVVKHSCTTSSSTVLSWIWRSPALFHTSSSCPLGLRFLHRHTCPVLPSVLVSRQTVGGEGQVRHYAKATSGISSLGKKPSKVKTGPVMEKKKLPVETDANKLVNYVCGSCLDKEGEDIKLKDDSEYPAWLWELNTGDIKPLEELDPDTDHYWNRVKALDRRRNKNLMRLKKF